MTDQKYISFSKPQKKRLITNESHWVSNIQTDEQYAIIESMYNNNNDNEIVRRQIRQKLTGYKSQDIHNQLYDKDQFIDETTVIQLLYESKLTCFYCQGIVDLLYDYVRQSNQWTLERMNNSFGHNRENIVIACLRCNLRRRTMYHTRYLYTKQIGKQKVIKLP